MLQNRLYPYLKAAKNDAMVREIQAAIAAAITLVEDVISEFSLINL
jgi:hypothetical protein